MKPIKLRAHHLTMLADYAREGMMISIPLGLGVYYLWDHYDKKEKD